MEPGNAGVLSARRRASMPGQARLGSRRSGRFVHPFDGNTPYNECTGSSLGKNPPAGRVRKGKSMQRIIRRLLCASLMLLLCAAAPAYADDVAVAPDPGAFFGAEPNESGTESDHVWFTYAFETEAECDRAFEEYVELLETGPFDLVLVDDSKDWLYRFDYVGPLDVTDLKDSSGWDKGMVLKLANFSNAGRTVQISVSKDIVLMDTGHRPQTPFFGREARVRRQFRRLRRHGVRVGEGRLLGVRRLGALPEMRRQRQD